MGVSGPSLLIESTDSMINFTTKMIQSTGNTYYFFKVVFEVADIKNAKHYFVRSKFSE